jgi:hypothetical protein
MLILVYFKPVAKNIASMYIINHSALAKPLKGRIPTYNPQGASAPFLIHGGRKPALTRNEIVEIESIPRPVRPP